MRRPDPSLPVVFDRRDALGLGLSPQQVSRRAAARWQRLHRGLYTAAELDEHVGWQAEVLAVIRSQARDVVLSHASAARAWRLPAPLSGWGATTFTVASGSTRRGPAHVVRVAPLRRAEVVALGAVAVTSVARTVVDCARHLPGRDALAIADAALHRGQVTPAQLQAVLALQQGWPGAAAARTVVSLADGRRESPLESWSAWCFAQLGVPQPTWQVDVLDTEGVFLGRVDAWWPEGVAGEADGRAKYTLPRRDRPADEVEAVHAERRREAAMRRTGAGLVRWGAADVLRSAPAAVLAEHVRRELAVVRHLTARVLDL